MGCYDTVRVPCPECSAIYLAQSKGGDCRLNEYDLDEAPADVMMDVNRHAPFTCGSCGLVFVVEVAYTVVARATPYVPEQDDELDLT